MLLRLVGQLKPVCIATSDQDALLAESIWSTICIPELGLVDAITGPVLVIHNRSRDESSSDVVRYKYVFISLYEFKVLSLIKNEQSR